MNEQLIFAGVSISSGRHPVTFAALDDVLNLVLLEKYEIAHIIEHLKQYSNISLALNVPSTKRLQGIYSGFKRKIRQAGFKPYAMKALPKQVLETKSQDCFRAMIGKSPLSRGKLQGRVQRALVLYDQGLRINDPMDFFEELTRHHMLSGVFPNELLYSASELDALATAYVSWLAVNEPGQITIIRNKIVLPKEPESESD